MLTRFWESLTSIRRRGGPVPAELATRIAHALLSERGEVSGARLAADLKTAWDGLDAPAREQFLTSLARQFDADTGAVIAAIDAYRVDPSPARLLKLQEAVEPPRQELLRRFNMAPGGTAALVGMRREVLRGLAAHPDWRVLDSDLLHLLRSWFNPGFLELRRIDWRTPAVTLEHIIEYEAVHEIQGWRDLRRRLEADRRCYAFFHRALPDEPLIFIEAALTRGMAARVDTLLDPDSPVEDAAEATHVVFYSITNCQQGLRGVSFGNFLIKQVAEDIRTEFPRVRTFATLSPIPGFARWLLEPPASAAPRVPAALDGLGAALAAEPAAARARLTDAVRTELLALCARYLVHEKRGREPLDPVARFHLANGARLERLNWRGNLSDDGLRRSLGITANYVYRLDDLEKNHEAYAVDGRVVTSRTVEKLAAVPKRTAPATRAG